MLKISVTIVFLFCLTKVQAQAGEWTWMNGDSTPMSLGNFGTQGVFDSLNTPPGLYESAEFTDKQGNFWLFGGGNNYADLWKFNPSINQWAWIKGTGAINTWGVYGTQGVPSPANNPGARGWGMTSWVDTSGNFWLYGGVGYDVNGSDNMLGDLWRYNISTNEWTWMKGADTVHTLGHYGTIGISDPANSPPCMWETNGSWTDANNNLWLFGGSSDYGSLNDIWEYNIASNEWTWIKGSGIPNPPAVFGIQGIPDINNTPSGRAVYSKWKDSNDNFWFFGGGYPQPHSDLWKYKMSTNEWTWMSGDTVVNGSAVLNTAECISSESNIPSGRYENKACWKISCDNLVLFGGFGTSGFLNDLWNYNIPTNSWTLMKGDTSINVHSVFGTKTISNPSNLPCGTGGAIGWKDNSDNLWLFGGIIPGGFLNTLWRFVHDATCPPLCEVTGNTEVSETKNNLIVFPNPSSSSLTISFNLSSPVIIEISITNVLGEEIYFSKTHSALGNFSKEINLKTFENGIYFLQLRTTDKIFNKKIIKQ